MAHPQAGAEQTETEPRPAAVTFVTTEHSPSTAPARRRSRRRPDEPRCSFGAVSGGLVALGLIATAAGVSTAFYAFALTLLPTLALVRLVTFNRVLQSGIHALVMSQADRLLAQPFGVRADWKTNGTSILVERLYLG
jgi:hypothetical protein